MKLRGPTLRELMVVLVIVACGVSIHDQWARRAAEIERVPMPTGPPPQRSGRILLQAAIPPAFEFGQPVAAACRVVNDSEDAIDLWANPGAILAVLLDEDGAEPPPAPEPWRASHIQGRPAPAGPPGPVHLAGGYRRSAFEVRLDEQFRLAPGLYTLEWRFRDDVRPAGREVGGNRVRFRVLQPSPPLSGRLALTLNMPAGSRYETGSGVPMSWTLRNETYDLAVVAIGPHRVEAIVRDESGQEMPRTDEGRRHWAAFEDGVAAGFETERRLHPGKSFGAALGHGLSQRYDLPAGRYTAELVYRPGDEPGREVRSAPVPFEMIPALGPRPQKKDQLVGPPPPPKYTHPPTGLVVTVDGNARTLIATGRDGSELWRRDLVVDGGITPRWGQPPIVTHIGEARPMYARLLGDRGHAGPFVEVVFSSRQFGLIDAGTGTFQLLGQD